MDIFYNLYDGEQFYLFNYGIECGLRLMGWQIFYYILNFMNECDLKLKNTWSYFLNSEQFILYDIERGLNFMRWRISYRIFPSIGV